MRITQRQADILNHLTCQRLTADFRNKVLVRSFRNSRGWGLLNYLFELGWQEDQEGSTAFYIIKNPNDEVLLFFSLKCGALFDPLNEEEIQQRNHVYQKLLHEIQVARTGRTGDASSIIESIRSGYGLTAEEMEQQLTLRLKEGTRKLRQMDKDKACEKNKRMVRVGETHPGVELVHFCANDEARSYWRKCGFGHPMGEVLFWWFIAPIIYQIQESVGCQYAFLFAADSSPDGILVNYYNVSLKFYQPEDLGTSKPRYDFFCQFMCQQIRELRHNREAYFENFNPDDDDQFV